MAELEILAARLAAVERRLDRLESGGSMAADRTTGRSDETTRSAVVAPPAVLRIPDVSAVVALVGRTLFVLAGAFLLRALTDSGRLDAGPGVLVGLAFAATWIGMADRAGRRGHNASAAFHGMAFVLIAFPLLFEATTRFHFLNPATAAAGIGGCTAIALAVGWRRRLLGLTWIASLGSLSTATALTVATSQLGPFAIFLVLLGVAALWIGYLLEWRLLRWPLALFADLAVLILSVRAGTPDSTDTAGVAFAAQIVLLLAYLGSFAARTLLLNRDVIPFEVAQTIAATAAGLGGAVYLTHVGGGLPLGVAVLALAAGCYGAAAIFVERRQSRRRNYYFYTSAGLIFALTGSALTMPPAAVGLVDAVFGVIAASMGRLSRHVTYQAHGAIYLMAAVLATGLFAHVFYGLGFPIPPQGGISVLMLSVLALCGAAMWGLAPEAIPSPSQPGRRIPRLIVLVLLLGGLLGAILSRIVPPQASPGFVATVRTTLLVGSILALASADRFWGFVEGAWLLYPLLILTGVKFILEDVRAGQPGTLFVGFALYGLALIAGPRLCRRRG